MGKKKKQQEHQQQQQQRQPEEVKKEEVEQESQEKNKSNKKRKEIAPYGNYRNYYGYRISQELDEDPRIKVMKKEWFEGKDCLDIGCNSGIITIHIAKKFCCRSILGIDIDSNRIEDAQWYLKKVVRMQCVGKIPPKTSKLDGATAETVNGSEHSITASLDEVTREISGDSPPAEINLFDIVSFRQENFVHSHHSPQGKLYDTILCLSVTKWIHLNWGDDGLISLFSKIFRLLHPGGILVLEPQPWSSYVNNHLVSETTAMNYHNIMLFPKGFQELLLDKIGFRTVEDITSGLSGSKTGFKRPILAFRK